ncbi:ribonuclease H-like domain-containing protein [Rossellomorea marisflavi]|uniref:ribonuclease H-like domain-containing protein n=1 Tax=Rossellomorea marisflavi TaxID=189381 RepID=UPI0025AFCEE8|nr:ribonuclease H-like domain-containing protein [Rossellomorea marisflavi]WJV20578.1 ribonuclease H-like domain-containing protein [Rossellomorea marisflavi]
MSLKNKLNRMKKHIIREEVEPVEKAPLNELPEEALPHADQWGAIGASPYVLDEDYCIVREKRYPLDHIHGSYSFRDAVRAVRAWQDFEGEHPLSARGLSPQDLFFFDTETTGLGGGAGNTIFLLGHARITESEVVVTQHVLPRPGSEIPLYHSFLSKVDYTTLVTYNGKAFDWPQVKTRHTLIREHVPKLPSFGHFDLYHGSRRLFKERLGSVKLVNVEKEVLGFHRKDDVPGYLAPMIYFDYVERRDPEGIFKVLEHNELDILSLITLYAHLSLTLLNPGEHESFEVGRWLQYTGNKERARTLFQKIVDEGDEGNDQALHLLALELKKEKDFKQAAKLWGRIGEEAPAKWQKAAFIELSKLHEHRFKDLDRAKEYAERAIPLVREGRESDHLQHRIDRLIRKMEKQ